MIFTISFPNDELQQKFSELLENPDSEIIYTITDEFEAQYDIKLSLVKASKEEYEVVLGND